MYKGLEDEDKPYDRNQDWKIKTIFPYMTAHTIGMNVAAITKKNYFPLLFGQGIPFLIFSKRHNRYKHD